MKTKLRARGVWSSMRRRRPRTRNLSRIRAVPCSPPVPQGRGTAGRKRPTGKGGTVETVEEIVRATAELEEAAEELRSAAAFFTLE
jgi:hypothetical protein